MVRSDGIARVRYSSVTTGEPRAAVSVGSATGARSSSDAADTVGSGGAAIGDAVGIGIVATCAGEFVVGCAVVGAGTLCSVGTAVGPRTLDTVGAAVGGD